MEKILYTAVFTWAIISACYLWKKMGEDRGTKDPIDTFEVASGIGLGIGCFAILNIVGDLITMGADYLSSLF